MDEQDRSDHATNVTATDANITAVGDIVDDKTPYLLGGDIVFPSGQWDVIVADPPWSYTGQQDKWGAASKFYPTQTDDWIHKLPVSDILSNKGVCFVWATSPRLDAAIRTIQQWGLHYRGVAFVWVKTKKDGTPIGAQGVRPSIVKPLCEFVLAGSPVKTGRPMALASEAVQQTVFAPKRSHSKKPDEVQDRIEQLYPNATKLELFARRERSGWDVWGNEVANEEARHG
jgi:N6-adenosine-specific RNA methylase IME4